MVKYKCNVKLRQTILLYTDPDYFINLLETEPIMEKYFFEVFENIPRQGPGSTEITRKAYSYLEHLPQHPKILDIGCGCGAQTIDLANSSSGTIKAIDLHKPLLAILNEKIRKYGLSNRVSAIEADMSNLPFQKQGFDLIWAEGSLYNMGIENGINYLRGFLKPGGYIAFSEACYFKEQIPAELDKFWKNEYPEIKSVLKNIAIIEKCGYKLIEHFSLPHYAWKMEFYDHIDKNIRELAKKYKENKEALECFDSILQEIDIFDRYNAYFGYEFFIVRI